jgi:hypothetical protein
VASQVKQLQMNMQVDHLRKSFGPLLEDLDDEQCDLFFSYLYVYIGTLFILVYNWCYEVRVHIFCFSAGH